MNEWYQTIMAINFTNSARANKFADELDKAEIESQPNDFGPSWLGNILHVLGEKLDETAHTGILPRFMLSNPLSVSPSNLVEVYIQNL